MYLGFQKKTIAIISAVLLLFFAAGTLAVLYPIYNGSKAAFENLDALLESDPETALSYYNDVKFITFRKKLSKRLHKYRYDVAKECLAEGKLTEAFESASLIGTVELLRDFQNDVVKMYLAEEDGMTKTFLRRYLVQSEYHKNNNETDPYIPYRSLGAVGRGFALSVNPDGTLAFYGNPPEGLTEAAARWGTVAAVAAYDNSVVAATLREKSAPAVGFGDNKGLRISVGAVSTALSPSVSETHTAVTLTGGGCYATNMQSTSGWSVVLSAAGNNFTAGVNWYGRIRITGDDTLAEEVADWSEIVHLAAGGDALYGLTHKGVLRAARSPFDVDGTEGVADVAAAPGKLIVLRKDGTAVTFGYNAAVSEAVGKVSNLAAVYAGVDGVLVREATGQYHYFHE